MSKISKNRKIFLGVFFLLLVIASGIYPILSGPHTPQDCINTIPYTNLDPPKIKQKEKDIISIEVGDITVYAYQSINKDVRIMQLKKHENIFKIKKYSYLGGVTIWNKDWSELHWLPSKGLDDKFSFWFSKEKPNQKESIQSYQVEVFNENYYFNINYGDN